MRFCPHLLLAMCVALAAGCAKHEDLAATGGSRSDGTVNLSYEYGSAENPQIDLAQGLVTARVRCQARGYSDAQAFGGQTKQCQAPSDYGCMRWIATMPYQCLGTGVPAKKT
jgi:YecR-like lipoprotein